MLNIGKRPSAIDYHFHIELRFTDPYLSEPGIIQSFFRYKMHNRNMLCICNITRLHTTDTF